MHKVRYVLCKLLSRWVHKCHHTSSSFTINPLCLLRHDLGESLSSTSTLVSMSIDSLTQHEASVALLSSQIALLSSQNKSFRIYHGSTNSTRASVRSQSNSLDVSHLKNILSIDANARTCLVEPNVSMDILLDATLKYGLMPAVVPEFPGITVGGAFSGTAGESSSFKHGFFDRLVDRVEMILADGTIVYASQNENEDLWEGAAGTFGTLGVVTRLEIKLIEAKECVELVYLPVKDVEEAVFTLRNIINDDREGRQDIHFLDGIMFGPTRGVIMVGKLTNRRPLADRTLPRVAAYATFDKPSDEWFYLHAQKMSDPGRYTANDPHTDIIPLKTYIFRYDRGAFWMGRYGFSYFGVPFNSMTRYMFDYFFHTRVTYHAFHRSGMTKAFIIQDMALPSNNMVNFCRWLDTDARSTACGGEGGGGGCSDIWPRWLCPVRVEKGVGLNPCLKDSDGDGTQSEMQEDWMLNIGLWGLTPKHSSPLTINRNIERKLKELGGLKWLYAQTYYTEDEFWQIYDRKQYDELRSRWKAQTLPNVYDKVGPSQELLAEIAGQRTPETWTEWMWTNVWPLNGLYGMLSAMKGGDYLRKVI